MTELVNLSLPDVRMADFGLADGDLVAAQSLGIVLPPSVIACIDLAIQAENQSALLSLGAGYALMNAKGLMVNSEFVEHIEKRGLSQQRASELMGIARLYTATQPEQRGRLIASGKSKMLLLSSADPEVIQDVLDDPEDGFAALSVRALRLRIRALEAEKYNETMRANNAVKLAAQLRDKQRLTRFEPFTEEVRAEVMALQREGELAMDGLLALFDRATLGYEATFEARLRVEHIWLAANAVLASATEMVVAIRDRFGDELPDRLHGEHYLTPEEAVAWRRIGQEIQSAHEAGKLVRKQERAEEQPRKPGRPRGAKNRGASV